MSGFNAVGWGNLFVVGFGGVWPTISQKLLRDGRVSGRIVNSISDGVRRGQRVARLDVGVVMAGVGVLGWRGWKWGKEWCDKEQEKQEKNKKKK